jgi:protein SCO1/2
VQVLFVTVDPERDTQEVLAQYVPAFDKRFWACAATCRRPRRWPRNSRCSTRRCRQAAGQLHDGSHRRQLCVRPAGHIRLFVKHGQGPQTLAHDIKLLSDG